MKFIRIKAIAKKEMLQIVRDPLSLAMGFLMPVLLLFIFGYAISLDVDDITTIVYDQDRSSMSRALVADLSASGYFKVVRYAEREQEIEQYLDAGTARVGLTIPVAFARDLRGGRVTQLPIVVDGSDSNTATIALGYFAALTELYARRISPVPVQALIETRARVWYNPELKSRNFIVPGLIAVIMMVIAALLTSLCIAREWERGTMEQLIATPVKTPELILGKIIPYYLIGIVDMGLSIAMATLLFEVPFRGSLLLLTVISTVFLFGGLSFGIIISIITKSQIVSSQISVVATYLPAFLLSGFMFSISNMTRPLQVITHVIPARYFVAILKGLFLKGSTVRVLYTEALFLLVFGVLTFAVANKKFTKRLG
jgi:ABC-2 type transport system permease protein